VKNGAAEGESNDCQMYFTEGLRFSFYSREKKIMLLLDSELGRVVLSYPKNTSNFLGFLNNEYRAGTT
jgi:hypothetical protein